jgi:hypothetical protein
MEWTSAVPFYGPAAVHDGKDVVQLKVLSDRRGEGGGIAWLVRLQRARACGSARISARGCRQSHSVAGSSPRAPDPGDLSRGAIHRLASEMCLINKEETVYA